MMHPIDHYVTLRRGQEELLRQAEYERMVRAAKLEKWTKQQHHRAFANWLGTHMVKWGQKLEQFGTHKAFESFPSAPHH